MISAINYMLLRQEELKVMGNRKDYTELTRYIVSNKDKFYRLAYSYLRNEQDAMDAVSESIVKAYESYDRLRNKEAVKTWFYRIIVNKCLDELRHRKKVIPLEGDAPDEEYQEDRYESIGDILYQAVNMLPEKYKTVILLKYYEEMTFEQIVEITGDNINTVKSRLYAGVERLRGIEQLKGVLG